MPRKARIDAPGALHHIIIRGIEGSPIFRDKQDYQSFLDRLGNLLKESSTACFAWALMSNHAHLLLRTGKSPISTVMRRLLTGHANFFNKKHQRNGHLFQNRYKSFLCEEKPYLLELVRYIHLNPLRAGIVKDLEALEKCERSGHHVIMKQAKIDWQDTDSILAYFGEKEGAARKAYEDFVAEGISKGKRPDLVGGGLIRSSGGWSAVKDLRETNTRVTSDERILGSSDFTESVLKHANESYAKSFAGRNKGIDIDHVIKKVADHLGLDPETICKRGRKRSIALARSIICALAADRLKLTGTDIAQKLNLTPSSVSKLIDRGRREPMLQDLNKIISEK